MNAQVHQTTLESAPQSTTDRNGNITGFLGIAGLIVAGYLFYHKHWLFGTLSLGIAAVMFITCALVYLFSEDEEEGDY